MWSCETCRYFKAYESIFEDARTDGECRRHTPRNDRANSPVFININNKHECWCGEWKETFTPMTIAAERYKDGEE